MKRFTWISLLLLGAALPASAETLTLAEAVDKALAANPSLTASREAYAASEAKADQSWSGFLPQLILSVGYKRATMNSPAPPYIDTSTLPAGFGNFLSREETTSYDNWNAGVTLNHTIWDFGRTLGTTQAAKELRAAAKSDVATSREQVRLNTFVAYYQVLAAQEVVAVSEETLKQMTQHLDVAKAQAAAGIRQRLDVARAEADLELAKVNLMKARNGQLLAKVQLALAMGQEPAYASALEVVRPSAAAEVDTADRDGLVSRALANRPEFASASARARASERLTSVASSGYFPSLGLSTGLNYQGYELDPDKMPLNWFAGVSLNWNAIGLIPVSGASREAEANVRAAEAQRRAIELSLRAEVESSALAFDEARERLKPTEALVASAAEALRLAEGRYGAGAGSLVEVTDAQAIYTQARLGKVQAEFDVETARARLLRAVGVAD